MMSVLIANEVELSSHCANRVYLVFRASSKLKPVSPLASASSQYVLVLVTTAIQVSVLHSLKTNYVSVILH